MDHLSVKDFEPENFTLEKYVQKLSQRNPRTGLGLLKKKDDQPFDARVLLESFQESVRELEEISKRNHQRVLKLEHVCTRQENDHTVRIKELESTYTDAFTEFQQLEDSITYVSAKVVHLGDQLEGSNTRQMRAREAQMLMQMLKHFQEKSKPNLPVFNDPARRLEAADLVYKLYVMARELPSSAKFNLVRENVFAKYHEVEKQLVDEFLDAQHTLDPVRMKECATALQPFSHGSEDVVSNYIHRHIPTQPFASSEDMFTRVELLCDKVHDQTLKVFDNPDVVMAKFVESVIERIIGKHVDSELGPLFQAESEREQYLRRLNSLYIRTMDLHRKLVRYNMTLESAYLSKMLRVAVFGKYLSTYANTEVTFLKSRCLRILSEFNEQAGIGRKGAASRGMVIIQSTDETYVSQEVCTSVLHEAKGALRRADALLSDKELSELVRNLYFTVLEVLCTEHFHTALDIATNMDSKPGPVGLFCQVVGGINSNMHLIEKLFRDSVMPCIHYPPVATACVERKRAVVSRLESKIGTGIEKTMSGMVSWVKQLLSTNQKKTDYKPELIGVTECTLACNRAVDYIGNCCRVLKMSLDGKNLELVLHEFGSRLHRVIYEHLQGFIINESGAMAIICDMNEYRNVIKGFGSSFLDELFENFQALCNIFIVKAENLTQVCTEEPYVNFERSVLASMVALRNDYKTAKLSKHFA